jgi:hypothetical protein
MEVISKEEMCKVCLYFKFHNNEIIRPPKHCTCLCELFKRKFICCKKGYSNLIRNIPSIVIYSPNPEVINTYYIQNSMNYLASAKTILEILTFTFEQKIEVLKNQESVDGKHPYFNYGEN